MIQQLGIFLLLLFSVRADDCPPGTTYGSSFQTCYLYVDTLFSFLAAEQFCVREGGHLVSIRNGFENSFILNMEKDASRDSYWTGGNYLYSQLWTWADGANITYSNWNPAALAQSDPSPNQCVAVKRSDGLWTKELCHNVKSFFCSIPPGTNVTIALPTTVAPVTPAAPMCSVQCPTSCDLGYTQHPINCNCYKFVNQARKYADASAQCANESAYLASIKTAEENCWLMNLCLSSGLNYRSSAPWIGLTCPNGNTADCRWKDNSTIGGYSNFEKNGSPRPSVSIIYFDIDNFSGSVEGLWSTPDTATGTGPYICQKYPHQPSLVSFNSRSSRLKQSIGDSSKRRNHH